MAKLCTRRPAMSSDVFATNITNRPNHPPLGVFATSWGLVLWSHANFDEHRGPNLRFQPTAEAPGSTSSPTESQKYQFRSATSPTDQVAVGQNPATLYRGCQPSITCRVHFGPPQPGDLPRGQKRPLKRDLHPWGTHRKCREFALPRQEHTPSKKWFSTKRIQTINN